MMLQHIAAKSSTNREAMSDLVSASCFILKQPFAPIDPEQLQLKKLAARSLYKVNDAGQLYLDDMSADGLRAAAAKLAEDERVLEQQFKDGNTTALAEWNCRRRAALGLLGELCLGIESNQALLRLSGGCELLVEVVESTGHISISLNNQH